MNSQESITRQKQGAYRGTMNNTWASSFATWPIPRPRYVNSPRDGKPPPHSRGRSCAGNALVEISRNLVSIVLENMQARPLRLMTYVRRGLVYQHPLLILSYTNRKSVSVIVLRGYATLAVPKECSKLRNIDLRIIYSTMTSFFVRSVRFRLL